MRRLLTAFVLLLPMIALASESGYPLDEMEPDLHDKASLQRGAKTYLNYCMGCHSLQYQRYIRTADDLGIPHDLMLEHLIFDPNVQIGDLMENSMSIESSKNWFGAAPPDLTLYSKLKGGPEYVYTYLRGFYEDPDRPFGVNNTVFENVGMPHVLVELQGLQRYVCKQVPKLTENGTKTRDRKTLQYVTEEKCGAELKEIGGSPLELVEGTGTLTPEEYDQVVYDLSNFLYYIAEPVRLERQRIGVYVLLFLAFFYVLTYLLGREYKKDFH
ncbi:MAG: cytochrome c1 [Gammaproteobacteria bacterium]|nr:cytochrome c1 [Gammaproteobacteria bacterium]